MAVIVKSKTPEKLWRAIRKGIAAGTVTTWKFSASGKALTHEARQWKGKAFLNAAVRDGYLLFNIVRSKGQKVDEVVYAEYHSKLIRMLLAHFGDMFGNLAVARGDVGDKT